MSAYHALEALSYILEAHPELGAEGRVLFLRARPHAALARFEGRLTVEQTWKPTATALEAAGHTVSRDVTGSFDTILLLPERQRDTIASDIARAHDLLVPGGTLIVSLHNDWGAKRTEQQMAEVTGNIESVSKHHSRVFWAVKKEDAPWNEAILEKWRNSAALRRILDNRFWSCPGLFHWDEIDAGSRLLTENLPSTLSGAAADLGCSWGYLSDQLLRNCPNLRSLDMYEADGVALEAARRNVGLVPCAVRPRLHWRDVTAGLGKVVFDVVVMNPPFHEGRDADPMLGIKFIGAASQALRSDGQLWLVANKQLPYERVLSELFEESRIVVQAGGFKVLHAVRPKPLPYQGGRERRGRREDRKKK